MSAGKKEELKYLRVFTSNSQVDGVILTAEHRKLLKACACLWSFSARR